MDRVHARPSRARTVALVATAAVLGAVAWSLGGEAEPPAPPSSRSTARLAERLDAPFPDLRLVLVDVVPAGAVIAVESRQGTFARGHEVFPGVRVDHIERDQVVLAFGNQTRTLVRPRADPPPVVASVSTSEAPRIDVRQLTTARPMAASVFLDEVQVRPSPRGGFVVEGVLPQSRYDRMGLRAGDVVYSLDTPAMAAVDEGSMVALMLQTEIELDVYRQGQPMRLRVALNTEP